MKRFLCAVAVLVGGMVPGAGAFADAAADLGRLAADARDEAVKVRGLEAKNPIQSHVASRGEIEKYVVGRIHDTGAQRSFDLTGASLSALGVIAPTYQVGEFVVRMAREQVAGFYDCERRTLFIADWIPAFLQRPTLVHEVTHALQDQNFGIARYLQPKDGLSEPYGAMATLIEGDATAVMMESMAGTALHGDDGDRITKVIDKMSTLLSLVSGLGDIPVVLRDSLLFPYIGGLRLVLTLRGSGDWGPVNALYRRPPLSTEQVLHPDKLRGETRDDPIEVGLHGVAGPGAGWRRLGTDILGELGIRLVLEQSLQKAVAATAAEGWGGDRFVGWRKGRSSVVMLWAVVWDTEADAVEGEAALRATKKPPVRLERRGDALVGVWGEATGREDVMIASAWKVLKRTPVHDLDAWIKAL